MKKALSVFLTAALAFGAFADEPVADVNIAEFSGNAFVQWGVDLDNGKTGFKNGYEVDLKLNLLNNGTKSTTGDGVWGELVLKTEEDTFIGWENGDDSNQVNDEYIEANTGLFGDNKDFRLKVYVDVAKIHIGPAYIGIKRGNTQTGELDMDAAIRSADDDQSQWLSDVGPANYSEGITAGFENDLLKAELDLRSYAPGANHQAKRTAYQYTDAYAAALEAELKGEGLGLDGLSVKAGASYSFAENFQASKEAAYKTAFGSYTLGTGLADVKIGYERWLGYSASAGYKLGIGDTFFLRPQLGFTGQTGFYEADVAGKKLSASGVTSMEMAAGLLFGWGEIGQDKNAGVWYLDDDMAKKVSPGVGVVAYIPFATTGKTTYDGTSYSTTTYNAVAARIMPSFYSGELIPGLTAAAYGDIVIPNTGKNEATSDKATAYAAGEHRAAAMAFTLGANYAIPVGEMTITPKAAMRFANAAYVDYTKLGDIKEKDDPVFGNMGTQEQKVADEDGITSDGNYMNLKLGVDVGGLIDNTTLSVIWETENILNKIEYGEGKAAGRYGPRFGTLNFKAKISL